MGGNAVFATVMWMVAIGWMVGIVQVLLAKRGLRHEVEASVRESEAKAVEEWQDYFREIKAHNPHVKRPPEFPVHVSTAILPANPVAARVEEIGPPLTDWQREKYIDDLERECEIGPYRPLDAPGGAR